MIDEQRGASRFIDDLLVRLLLRVGTKGPILAGPTDGKLDNISSSGAGVIIDRIFVDNHHLFYSPRDSTEQALYLQFILFEEDEKNIPIPVKPIWFDQIQTNDAKYFKIGLEFLFNNVDEEGKHLIKMVSQKQKEGGNWLSNFLGKIKDLHDK